MVEVIQKSGAALIVVSLGLLCLAPGLGRQSLWLDESLTVGPALTAGSISELVSLTRTFDTQPPASHLLLYQVKRILPSTEFYLRLPSLIAVEAGLLFFYSLIRVLWGASTALPALVFAQISPLLCYYAAEARNYGLWFFAIACSFWLMVQWQRSLGEVSRARPWVWAAVWGLMNGLGLWTQLFHVFLIAGQLGIVVGLIANTRGAPAKQRSCLGTAGFSCAISFAVFAPWLLSLSSVFGGRAAGVGWTRDFSWTHLGYHLFAALFGFSLGPNLRELHTEEPSRIMKDHALILGIAGLGMVLVVILYLLVLRSAWRHVGSRWQILPLAIFAVTSLLGPLAFSAVYDFPLHPRHLLIAWPILPLVLGIAWTRGGWLRWTVLGIAAVQGFSLWNLLQDGYYAKDDQRGAVQFAEAQSTGETYVLAEGTVASYYCKKAKGEGKYFLDFDPRTQDVWLLDNRPWEPQNTRFRKRLERKMKEMGFSYEGDYSQYRGIVLRHWGIIGVRLRPAC